MHICWLALCPPAHAQDARQEIEAEARLLVLVFQALDERRRRIDRADGPDALPTAPHVAPRLGRTLGLLYLPTTEAHRARIALGQGVRIEPRVDDRRPQIVAVDAGEEVCVDNLGGVAVTIICLYAPTAFASSVAMKAEPAYAKSAPIACAAKMERPVAIDPDRARGPSNHSRISCTSAKGDRVPACPPAPAATAMRPSAPFEMAFCAKSCSSRRGGRCRHTSALPH